jgi:hypothetical protein
MIQMCGFNHVNNECVMSMTMENLTIDQYWDTLHYASIQGGGY